MTANDSETVEAIDSYARRADDEIRLVLRLPEAREIVDPTVTLRLRGARGQVVTTATVTTSEPGVLLTASLPARSLRPGIHRLAMRPSPEAPFRKVRARLLTSHRQPIALLTGPVPRTRIQPPRQKPRQEPGAGRRPQAVQGVATFIDQVLRRLPADQASRYRASLHKVAHRVFPGY